MAKSNFLVSTAVSHTHCAAVPTAYNGHCWEQHAALAAEATPPAPAMMWMLR